MCGRCLARAGVRDRRGSSYPDAARTGSDRGQAHTVIERRSRDGDRFDDVLRRQCPSYDGRRLPVDLPGRAVPVDDVVPLPKRAALERVDDKSVRGSTTRVMPTPSDTTTQTLPNWTSGRPARSPRSVCAVTAADRGLIRYSVPVDEDTTQTAPKPTSRLSIRAEAEKRVRAVTSPVAGSIRST